MVNYNYYLFIFSLIKKLIASFNFLKDKIHDFRSSKSVQNNMYKESTVEEFLNSELIVK